MESGHARPSRLKAYLIPILFSIGFVLLSPLGLLVIFLSGDSCCGENTSATMIGVTVGIVVLLSLTGVAVSSAVKLVVKKNAPDFSVLLASLIMAAPASLIYVVFVTYVAVTGF